MIRSDHHHVIPVTLQCASRGDHFTDTVTGDEDSKNLCIDFRPEEVAGATHKFTECF